MIVDTVVVQPATDLGEPSVAGVSWPAVAAGAVVSCALAHAAASGNSPQRTAYMQYASLYALAIWS